MKGLPAAFVFLVLTWGAFANSVGVESAKAQPSAQDRARARQTRKGCDSRISLRESVPPFEFGRFSTPHFYTKGYLV